MRLSAACDASGLQRSEHVETRALVFRYDGQSPYLARTIGTRSVWNLLYPGGAS